MLSYLFRQLINSCGIFVRTIQAFFTRKLTGLWARIRRLTNFSRQATKVAADSLQGAATAIKKPTKREDFIETKRLFISKSFLVLLVVGLAAAVLLAYFAVWPFLLSHFFTARFSVDDKRVGTWTGRVIVYADQERTLPLYSGKLADGVLQGQGREYDSQGLISYEGNFIDGVRSGAGKAYRDGVLVYEGGFSDGAYSGRGRSYEDGFLSYVGEFTAGTPSGEGTSYYPGGGVRYQGSFSDGVWEGSGITRYPTGEQSYMGTFSAGLREGEGTEYDKTGRVVYRGGFAQDQYSGDGIYYPAEGEKITASFENGVTGGAIQWYKGGALYYEGGADDLTPSGFGTLYGSTGKALYEGEMAGGTINGAWLLGLTAAEVRAAFAEGTLTESENPSGGFTIASPLLGAAVVCSYASAETESTVCEVYLWDGTDKRLALLPWSNGVALSSWMAGTPKTETRSVSFPAGVPLKAEVYQVLGYSQEDYFCEVLAVKEGTVPAALHWITVEGMPPETMLPASESAEETGAAAESRIEVLLDALEQMGNVVTIGGGDSPYLGEGDPMAALADAETPEKAAALIETYLDYLSNAETCVALEEQRTLQGELLLAAQTELDRGAGDAAAVETLQEQVDGLTRKIETCSAAMKKAELLAESAGGTAPADLALGGLTTLFDPAALDTENLPLTAVTYAQAMAGNPADADAAAIELELKLSLVDLGVLYIQAEDARTAYETAVKAAQAASGAFAMGKLDQAGLYTAQCARSETRSSLYAALSEFTRQVNALNVLTGGWVSRTNGWCAAALLPLYDAQIQAAAPGADPESPQPADTPAPETPAEPLTPDTIDTDTRKED